MLLHPYPPVLWSSSPPPPLGSSQTSSSGCSPTLSEGTGNSDEKSAKAIVVSDERTIYLVNMFIENTVEFLNTFAVHCDDKLMLLHRKIVKLDQSLALLEGKLCSIEENNASRLPTSQKAHQSLTRDKISDLANLTGESSGSSDSRSSYTDRKREQ